MPLIVNKKLPAYDKLKKELVSEISTERAKQQDIRPLEIGILNLMPSAVVERTELQMLRLLANTPLQIRLTFIYFDIHKSKSNQDHFNSFYKTIAEVKKSGLDGLIVTGANLEEYDFEEVLYWSEIIKFFDWARKNVTSTIFSCWAVHAALYHQYKIRPLVYEQKRFGIFPHRVYHELHPVLLAGVDDEMMVPHSRWRGVERRELTKKKELQILIESAEVGPHLIVGRKGREVYMQGHPEYDRNDIAGEYFRDKAKGIKVDPPKNYFPDNDKDKVPTKNWGANGQVFYANWINWVYQMTNVDVKKPLMK